jgi:DNA-binding transcriptional ArsR family regulator
MSEIELVKILAELGHTKRLSVYKFIMKYGSSGIIIGEVGKQLAIAPSTLNFHLNRLVDAGLIIQAKNGREVYCSANFERLDSAIDLLTSECCTVPES